MKLWRPRPISLRQRLIMGVGAMLVPLVVLAGGAFISLEEITKTFETTDNETLEQLFPLAQLESQILEASTAAKTYLSTEDEKDYQKFVDLSRKIDQTYTLVLNSTNPLPEKQTLLQTSQKEWQAVLGLSEAVFSQSRPLDRNDVGQLKENLDQHTTNSIQNIKSLNYKSIHWQLTENLAEVRRVRQTVRFIIATVFGSGLVIAGGAGWLLSRSILRPLTMLEHGVSRFGEGNLSQRIYLNTKDELAQLAQTFNAMAAKLEQSQSALTTLATVDGLTGVYNRHEFNRRLPEELERSRREGNSCSLIMGDIDFFKKLNDTYGHQGGDEALRYVATILKREIRMGDQVARYGGEEFAIILPNTTSTDAWHIAERMRKAIADHPIPLSQGQNIHVTMSLGFATFPTDADSDQTLIELADQSLYQAKRNGRNRVSHPQSNPSTAIPVLAQPVDSA